MKIHDISLPIRNGMTVWPGDPPVALKMTMSISEGRECNVTGLQMGAHTGTHIDAPSHFFQDGATVDTIPIETLIGPCIVIELDARHTITKDDLEKCGIRKQSRIIIKTRNSGMPAKGIRVFNADYVSLGMEAATHLVEMKAILVGIDCLSIEPFESEGSPVHKLLLKNSITIVEGLNLAGIKAGAYELICLPLKLQGCEAAPARVLLRELS